LQAFLGSFILIIWFPVSVLPLAESKDFLINQSDCIVYIRIKRHLIRRAVSVLVEQLVQNGLSWMVLVKPLVWEFLLQESQRARAFESVFSRRLGDLAVLARRPLSHDSATDPMQDGQPLLLAHAVVCTQDVADRILCF
jgi:hypothetical protein